MEKNTSSVFDSFIFSNINGYHGFDRISINICVKQEKLQKYIYFKYFEDMSTHALKKIYTFKRFLRIKPDLNKYYRNISLLRKFSYYFR